MLNSILNLKFLTFSFEMRNSKLQILTFYNIVLQLGGGTFSHTACCSGLHARLEAIRMNIFLSFGKFPYPPSSHARALSYL